MAVLNDQSTIGLANRFHVVIDPGSFDWGSWQKAEGLDVSVGDARVPRRRRRQRPLVLPGQHQVPAGEAAARGLRRLEEGAGVAGQQLLPLRQEPGARCTINLYDSTGTKVVLDWELKNAIPKKWSINSMDAGASQISIETIEFDHEGFLKDDMTIG